MKRTGKYRYRAQRRWFRQPLLVLQLEVAGNVLTHTAGFIDTHAAVEWRDALVTDMVPEMLL
jgi:hypothetical protein